MPIYECQCCKFSTYTKTHFTRHLSTTKHLNNINKPQSEDEGFMKMVSEKIAILKKELAERKKEMEEIKKEMEENKKEMEENMKENAELKKQIAEMKPAIQESKQVVIYINN